MRHLPALITQELRSQMFSPASYAAAVLYLITMCFFYVGTLTEATRLPQESTPPEIFFKFFWLPMWFMVPMLTMRSFAEERRLGTLETLLTTPVSAFEVVVSKFTGAYLLYVGMWLLTMLFPLMVLWVAPHAVEAGQLLNASTLIGGYTFIAISGILYIAIGIFASSLTRSQLIAGMLSFCILFIFTFAIPRFAEGMFTQSPEMATMQNIPEYLRTIFHLEDFTRGVLDSRPLFLYISNALLLLGLTTIVVRNKA